MCGLSHLQRLDNSSRNPATGRGQLTTSDRQLPGDGITIGGGQAEHGQQDREVVADVIDVLLRVDQLVEGGDAVAGEEAVVGRGVQTRAWTADIGLRVRRAELVGGVTDGRDTETSLSTSRDAVLGVVVGELGRDGRSRDMALGSIVGAGVGATDLPGAVLLAAEEAGVDALLECDPGKG